jgi:hypothetical protein
MWVPSSWSRTDRRASCYCAGPTTCARRSALGARPQTAAAAVILADHLPPGPGADDLRDTAALTARELRLTWLLRSM